MFLDLERSLFEDKDARDKVYKFLKYIPFTPRYKKFASQPTPKVRRVEDPMCGGYGLVADEFISARQVVYVCEGRVIVNDPSMTHGDHEEQLKLANTMKMELAVQLDARKFTAFDACVDLKHFGYVNHSCEDANLEPKTKQFTMTKDIRKESAKRNYPVPNGRVGLVYFVAKTDIAPGTPLTFSYYKNVKSKKELRNLLRELRNKDGTMMPVPKNMIQCMCRKGCTKAILQTGSIQYGGWFD